jgi:hypothetical protein
LGGARVAEDMVLSKMKVIRCKKCKRLLGLSTSNFNELGETTRMMKPRYPELDWKEGTKKAKKEGTSYWLIKNEEGKWEGQVTASMNGANLCYDCENKEVE